jgi:hypothetical protein
VNSNYVICTFRHALSLDERRVKFKANLLGNPTDKNKQPPEQKPNPEQTQNKGKPGSQHHTDSLTALERKFSKDRAAPTDVDQVNVFVLMTFLRFQRFLFSFSFRFGLLDTIAVIHLFLNTF